VLHTNLMLMGTSSRKERTIIQ